MSAPARGAVIAAAEDFVREEMSRYDGSHDWYHVDRVRRNAMSLADEEGVRDEGTRHVVELAALLHDVNDHKYSKSDTAGATSVGAFLEGLGVDEAVAARVVHVVANVGFSTEIGGRMGELTTELAIVQDADRLDAIGAVGVARTFCFGGARGRKLYVPDEPVSSEITQAEYLARQKDGARDVGTIAHFHEKLFKLAGMMKTEAGRRRARKRHDFMRAFVDQFIDESECRA